MSDANFPPLTEVTTPRWLSRRMLALAAAAILTAGCALVCAGALLTALLQSPSPQPVTIIVGDTAQQAETRAATVADLLNELGITLNAGDDVSPPLDNPIAPNLLVRVERSRPVTITVDDVPQTVQTTFDSPFDILKSAGVAVGPFDRVRIDGTTATLSQMLVWPVPVTHIQVQHAVAVQIDDGGQQRTIQTTSATVGEALFEAGVTLYLADTVTPDINTALTGDTTITIQRSRPVTIIADGVSLETRSQGTTVASALADAGVTLLGLDYSIPAEASPLRPGMHIRVIRVTETVEARQDVLPFETVYQADSNLELDQRQVLQEGQNGIQQTNIRIRYENGIEVSRQEESSTIASEPVNRVITYGTRIVLRVIDTPEGPREYWRRLRMYATIYYPEALGGDNVTATGRRLTKGVVASDPKVIPYDTQLYVPDYGVGVMADTGMPTPRLWIDLGYDDDNWIPWSRWVDVYLLTPVPETINYFLPYSD